MKLQTHQRPADAPEKEAFQSVYYVYAVIPGTSAEGSLGIGIDGVHEIQRIHFKGLQAVVSKVPYASYSQEALEERMENRDWLEKAVRSHTSIVNAIQSDGGIVPMRFLTLCKDEDEVVSYLRSYEDQLIDALRSVSGAHEWGIKVYCDTQKLQGHLEKDEEEMGRPRKDRPRVRKGTSFLLQKKKNRLAKEALMKVCLECKEACHAQLTTLSRSSEVIPAQNHAYTDMPAPLLFNGAYLVADRQAQSFHERVDELANQYGEKGFAMELTGPWPPYHFIKQLSKTI